MTESSAFLLGVEGPCGHGPYASCDTGMWMQVWVPVPFPHTRVKLSVIVITLHGLHQETLRRPTILFGIVGITA